MRRPRNFSWVDEHVAGSAMPRSREEIRWLHTAGVRVVISLDPDLPDEVAEAIRELGMVHYVFPVEDFSAPTVEQLEQVVTTIDEHASKGEKVVVHCLMGCGRTGTILAAYFVWHGAKPDRAIRDIRSMRPCSIETDSQEAAIFWFWRHLQSRRTRSGRRGSE